MPGTPRRENSRGSSRKHAAHAAPFLHAGVMSASRVQDILRRLESDAPLALGKDAVRWRARRLEERRFSTIFLLEPATGRNAIRSRLDSDELVLKVYLAAQPARRQKEFDDLRLVHEALGRASGAGVVRPVACYAEWGALVTARARGEEVGSLLR